MTQSSDGIQLVADAIARSGRFFKESNGEINTRCGFCGDSRKSQTSAHFYINTTFPHPCFCQRCGYKSGFLSQEILESLSLDELEVSTYAREISKEIREKGGSSVRRQTSLNVGARHIIPLPDMNDPIDASVVQYLENRIGGDPLSEAELNRYKVVTTGLYSFLEANGLNRLTVSQREGDRLNDTCIGFLSADERYIIFRTMDNDFVKAGGRRFTNYKIYDSEGSKSFASRADISLIASRYSVVCSESIIGLIQVERIFFGQERWKDNFIGLATCGSSHATIIRQLFTLGILNFDLNLFADNEPRPEDRAKTFGMLNRVTASSPFFHTGGVTIHGWINTYPGEKDFGVTADKIRKTRLRIETPAYKTY